MNELVICTILDSKAEAYLPPFTMRSDAEAIRAFGDSVEKGGTPLADHPEDFFLYAVGTFNQETGEIVPCDRRSLACGMDFKKESK